MKPRCRRVGAAPAFLLLTGLLVASANVSAQEAVEGESALVDAKVLDIAAKQLDIVPKLLDIEGMALGVEGTLADLGAKVTEKEIKIALSGDILFDFDKDTLRPDAFPTLEKVAEVLSQYPEAPVVIEGHTDSKGKEKYNQNLSERRAKSVKDWLVQNAGADGGRIKTKGWGEAKPAVPNAKPDGSDDPDGRQQNRRVEITIKTG
jgi:outer membrane protein OmpA-like peptidoglycan-associated protein